MLYLDSEIIGFINYFYYEVQKQKVPWTINVYLHDPAVISDCTIRVTDNNIHKSYMLYFSKERISSSSYEQLTKDAFEEIRKELDRWSLENH